MKRKEFEVWYHTFMNAFQALPKDLDVASLIDSSEFVANYVTKKFQQVEEDDPMQSVDEFDLKGLVNNIAKNAMNTKSKKK
jgi:hypothetical protein